MTEDQTAKVMEGGATSNPSSDPFAELITSLWQALQPPPAALASSLDGVASPMAQPAPFSGSAEDLQWVLLAVFTVF